MNGDSVLNFRGREQDRSRFRGLRVTQPQRVQALRDGVVLGVVTVLHLSFIAYLTIPPTPMDGPRLSLAVAEAAALKVRFIDAAPSLRAPPPVTMAQKSTVRARHSVAPAKVSVSTESSKAPAEVQHADIDVVTPQSNGPPTPYGNPLLKGGLAGNQAGGALRLPGAPDNAFVGTIALRETPSPKQVLRSAGQFMNCSQVRIARFLSASEMDKRRITKQQLDQAFTEFGCK